MRLELYAAFFKDVGPLSAWMVIRTWSALRGSGRQSQVLWPVLLRNIFPHESELILGIHRSQPLARHLQGAVRQAP